MLRSSHQFLSSFLYYVIVIVIVTSFKFNSAFSQDSTSVNDSTQTDSLKTKEEEGKFFKKLFVKKHQYIRGDPFIDSVTRELVIPFDSVGSSVQIDSIRPADKKRIIFHTLSKANLVEMMNQKESYFIPGQLFKKFKLNSPGVYNKNEELFFENKISAFFTMSAQPIWNKSWDYYFLKHVFRYLVEPIVLSLEIPLTVRMYHAESKPVWNPSYEIIPKIHWAPKNVNKPVFSNIILSWGPMIHHSNGQEKLLWDTSGTVPYNEHFGSLST
jgi:hypothetical protein